MENGPRKEVATHDRLSLIIYHTHPHLLTFLRNLLMIDVTTVVHAIQHFASESFCHLKILFPRSVSLHVAELVTNTCKADRGKMLAVKDQRPPGIMSSLGSY